MTWAAGEVIAGKYRLDRPLGEGGMGTVWRAVHVTLGQPVALKALDVSGPRADAARRRFLREARVAAKVRHRHLVYVNDFGETEDGAPFMAMELLEGQTLAERLVGGPTLTVGELLRIAEGCLAGLAAVHEAGIVHRDLKPQNVFLARDAEGEIPKLLDFGLSLGADGGEGRVTREGAIVGTLEYLSPEQARAQPDVDARSDLYAMGALLYEALSGEPPFTAATPADLLVAILHEEPVPLVAVRPELGEPLSAVVMRALSRDPAARFAGARQMREALTDALARFPEAAAEPLPETFEALRRASAVDITAPSDIRPTRRPDRRLLLAAGAVAVLAPALACAGWAIGQLFVAAPISPTTAPVVRAAPDAGPPGPVHVELDRVVEGAVVLVDGEPSPSGTSLELPRDGQVHTIEVRLSGFLPWRVGHVALADARYAVTLEPGSTEEMTRQIERLRNRARDAFAHHRYGEAAAAYEEATRASPGDARMWSGLGAARLANGEASEAVAAYRRALALDPGSARSHLALARALDAAGDAEGARAELDEALRLEPDNAEALRLRTP